MQKATALALAVCGALALGAGLVFGVPGAARQEIAAGRLAFPDLAPKLQTANRIEVVRGDRTLVVTRAGNRPEDRWGIADRGGYPVQTEKLRGILTGLTELRLVEPRTSDPAQYDRLGLGDPRAASGSALLLRVLDTAGQVIAEITLGHRRVRTQGGVPEEIYVRLPNQAQTWLAEGRLAVDADPQLWFDRDVADIPNGRIDAVQVQRGTDPLRFARQDRKPVLAQPAEHPPLDEYRLEDVFRALENLTFTDVQVRDKVPGDPVATTTYTTNDGLTLTAQSRRAGDQFWVLLSASGPGSDSMQARWSGWGFQLGQWKEKAIAPTLADLVAAPPNPAPPARP